MSISTHILLLLTLALLPACQRNSSSGGDDDSDTGSDSDTDTDVDADSDTDSDSDSETDGDWCGSGLDGDCPEESVELAPVIHVDELPGEVSFVALSDHSTAILAMRTDGETAIPLVVVLDPGWWEYGTAEPASPLTEPLSAIAVEQVGGELPWHIALLCSETACALWGTDAEDGEDGILSPIDGGEVPSSMTVARGLKAIEIDGYRLCVFGDGIACFDGATWAFELDPGTGPLINDLESFGFEDIPFAVGDEGRILRKLDTGWITEVSGTTEALVDISAGWGDHVAILGVDGALIVGESDPSSWQLCEAGGAPMIGLAWFASGTSSAEYIELLTANGAVLQIDAAGDTCSVAVEIEGEALAITTAANGTCWETRVLSEQALYNRLDGCTE